MTDDPNRRGYDMLAGAYAQRFGGELDHKPFDRAMLRAFADLVRGRGKVADIGCGPGHVGAFLRAEGLEVEGVDSSTEMVRVARAAFGVRGALRGAGFDVTAVLERQGDAAVEHPSLRAYVFAQKRAVPVP